MRLLHAPSFELCEFPDDNIPPYAILSHTWENDEVLFLDVVNEKYQAKSGFNKIRYACEEAYGDGYGYVWVDTCCIDKSSSAELSEAINSMYKWYQQAQICYAYLADVYSTNVETDMAAKVDGKAFRNSRWFERGWTLQELIAPSDLIFFTADWNVIGTKNSLRDVLASITQVDSDILTHDRALGSASIAQRMSWAAERKTTRVEDVAYCLMGIFDVNMPLLYGEGSKAFIRLQEEIMKHSDDQSLFAWYDFEADENKLLGLLAKSPSNFIGSGDIIARADREDRAPFAMSNKGLQIYLPLMQNGPNITAALDCISQAGENYLCILLQKLDEGSNRYARVNASVRFTADKIPFKTSQIYVPQEPMLRGVNQIYPQHIIQLRNGPSLTTRKSRYTLTDIWGGKSVVADSAIGQRVASGLSLWTVTGMSTTFKILKGTRHTSATLHFSRDQMPELVIILGSAKDFGVAFDARDWKSKIRHDFSQIWMPHETGDVVFLERSKVSVTAETTICNGKKYYMTDIHIEELEAPPPPSPKTDIADGIPHQQDPNSPTNTKPKEPPGLKQSFKLWRDKLGS